jgi:hypothetical protein
MSADICRAIMSCINVEYGLVPTSQSCPSIKRQDTPCSRSRDGCIAAGMLCAAEVDSFMARPPVRRKDRRRQRACVVVAAWCQGDLVLRDTQHIVVSE